jgi:hypothetical protein
VRIRSRTDAAAQLHQKESYPKWGQALVFAKFILHVQYSHSDSQHEHEFGSTTTIGMNCASATRRTGQEGSWIRAARRRASIRLSRTSRSSGSVICLYDRRVDSLPAIRLGLVNPERRQTGSLVDYDLIVDDLGDTLSAGTHGVPIMSCIAGHFLGGSSATTAMHMEHLAGGLGFSTRTDSSDKSIPQNPKMSPVSAMQRSHVMCRIEDPVSVRSSSSTSSSTLLRTLLTERKADQEDVFELLRHRASRRLLLAQGVCVLLVGDPASLGLGMLASFTLRHAPIILGN